MILHTPSTAPPRERPAALLLTVLMFLALLPVSALV